MNQDIKMIEQRSKEEIINLLKINRLGQNKRKKWEDYSAAKKIIFQGQFIDCKIYDKQIGWIVDFLKL